MAEQLTFISSNQNRNDTFYHPAPSCVVMNDQKWENKFSINEWTFNYKLAAGGRKASGERYVHVYIFRYCQSREVFSLRILLTSMDNWWSVSGTHSIIWNVSYVCTPIISSVLTLTEKKIKIKLNKKEFGRWKCREQHCNSGSKWPRSLTR